MPLVNLRASVVLGDINDEATEIVSELNQTGEKCVFARCDVTNPADLVNLFTLATDTFGTVDVGTLSNSDRYKQRWDRGFCAFCLQ